MLLTRQNSTNPAFWGKDLKIVIDGQTYDPELTLPDEIDFLKEFTGPSWAIAKYYYGKV